MCSTVQQQLTKLLAERVRFAVPLAGYTSFRIGGPADAVAEPATTAELQALLSILHRKAIPSFVLGAGTNILISDKGVRGVVVKLGDGFNGTQWCENGESAHVQVGAARPLGRFVREAGKKGYSGMEFAEGIPGSVGGGLLMNAGAFGSELSQVVEAISGVGADGRWVRLPGADIGFTYRRTALPPGLIIGAIDFRLCKQEQELIMAAMRRAQHKRRQTQPHGYPNAGSIFKNPPGVYAGRLIEDAGLKGCAVGGARVSEQHANFIVNANRATATDVKQLMEIIQQTVWNTKHVWLEPEIRLVGEW